MHRINPSLAIFIVRLFDQGASIIEVSDDGCGIPPESRSRICLPHATSKLLPTSSQDDTDLLHNVTTLGFRGEALFSLANLSKTLMVATRTAEEELACKLEFQPNGSVRPNSTQQIPKKIGTTVAVVNFFDRVPVRRQDFLTRLGTQRTRLLRRMESYFLFCPGISMHLMDMIGTDYFDSRERTLMQTTAASKTLAETVSSVLGPKVVASLCPVELDLTTAFDTSGTAAGQQDQVFRVEGLISHASPSKKCTGVKERQLYAIQRRPVDMPKLSKRLNHLWKSMMGGAATGSASHIAKPFLILHFTLPASAYDVNLEPDKRKVVLENEDRVFDLIEEHVAQLWSEQTDGKFPVGLLKARAVGTAAGQQSASGRNEELDSEEDDDENDDEDDDNNQSPSRFSRRYAFVNDVRRMRLQHQYDDGRATSIPEQEEARKKQVLAKLAEMDDDDDDESEVDVDLQMAYDQDAYGDAGSTISLSESGAAEITPPTEEHKAAELVGDQVVGVAPAVPLVLNRRLSPGELRRSRVMQRSMNLSNERDDARSVVNAFDSYRSGAVSAETSQADLERFGFSSSRDNQTVNDPTLTEQSKRSVGEDLAEAISKRQRRSASGVAPTFPQAHGPATPIRDGGFEEKADQRRVSLERGRSSPSSPREDDTDEEDNEVEVIVEPAFPHQRYGMKERTNSSIVFDTFTGTEEVVLQSRRERLAMRDRRLAYDNSLGGGVPPVQSDIVTLSKEDFSSMRVIGQFNLGFILAVSKDNNLWILDQHACDEKFNFEKLMAETVISEQRLIAPMPLELMPAEESCIIDNMEIFEKNGFRFQVDWDKAPRHRLALTALPHSGAPDGRKAVQFGKEDVSALCHILGVDESSASHDGAAGAGTGADGSGTYGNNAVRRYTAGSKGVDATEKVIARLPKAIAMFASRACRGSIMIGQALSQNDMDRIIKRLKDVEHPWNCPHGRPTMRHVLALESLLQGDDQKARELIGDTAATMMSQEDAGVCSHEEQQLDTALA